MFVFVAVILIALAIALMKLFHLKTIPIIAILVALGILVVSLFVTQVPTGFTGVLTTFGRVEDRTLESGINFKFPWQKIITMDNREQRASFNFNAFSSDIQQTDVYGSINYKIDQQTAMTLYKTIGTDYSNTLISPRLLENTKVVFSRYTAENLISKRDILADEILELMQIDLEEYGIDVISISIEDIDFTDAFTNAIEAKQVATQEKLRAQTQQEQATMEAEAQAERQRISAQAEADVVKIEADAEAYSTKARATAEAEANAKINASLTRELIDYVQANNWNGQLPTTFMGADSGTVPILNVAESVG
jgi:regulator of protease activity HflC (stomatin/prohibitin superfamily)